MHLVKATTEKAPSSRELANRQLARRAASEGFVLLENDGILPLKTRRVALFGAGARMTVKGGIGSGAVRERYSVSIYDGLKAAGVEITSDLWLDNFDTFYADTYKDYEQRMEELVKGVKEFYRILGMIPPFEHPTGMEISEEELAASREGGCDTAIYVLARQAGEGNDRELKAGDYLLDAVEEQNLSILSERFEKLIVVINAGGIVDLSFLDKIKVNARVYFVQGGEEGGNALADVLLGEKNFSGKLATSIARDFSDVPSKDTYSSRGQDEFTQIYNEGIYVGYRYFDSFDVKPRYPFGYGLSYTSFSLKANAINLPGEAGSCEVTVTNTGSTAGREVVQLYATVPFGKKGAEAKRLISYQKTSEIPAGESETLTLSFSVKDLAVYDEERSAWVLEEGDYLIRLGADSKNLITVAAGSLEKEILLEQCQTICQPKREFSELVPPARAKEEIPDGVLRLVFDRDKLGTKVHTYEKPAVNCEPYVAEMTDEELVTLTVGGGTGNKNLPVEVMGASGSTTPDLYESRGIPNAILSDGPAGLNLTPRIVELADGSYKASRVPEVLEAYKRYLFGMSKYAMLSQMADPKDGIEHYQYATAWPCSQLLAQTFDDKLAEEVGDAIGCEMEEFGVTVWLAPGMNIHRNPLCGRTFEYYSEDPLVSGKMAAAIVRGVQQHPGKGMSIKHFAANNCELQRNFSDSVVSERALRQLYLRGFEIAVKESAPMTVMAAYNKVNGTYCTNNYDLLVKVLRNEWGFEGLVMSDWDSMKAQRGNASLPLSGDVQKAAAAQCDLICPGRPDQKEALLQGLADGKVTREDLERSASRILRMVRTNTVLPCR